MSDSRACDGSRARCVSTVRRERCSLPAISALVWPSAIRRRISVSRGAQAVAVDRLTQRVEPAATRRAHELLAACRRADRCRQLAVGALLEHEPDRAGLECLLGEGRAYLHGQHDDLGIGHLRRSRRIASRLDPLGSGRSSTSTCGVVGTWRSTVARSAASAITSGHPRGRAATRGCAAPHVVVGEDDPNRGSPLGEHLRVARDATSEMQSCSQQLEARARANGFRPGKPLERRAVKHGSPRLRSGCGWRGSERDRHPTDGRNRLMRPRLRIRMSARPTSCCATARQFTCVRSGQKIVPGSGRFWKALSPESIVFRFFGTPNLDWVTNWSLDVDYSDRFALVVESGKSSDDRGSRRLCPRECRARGSRVPGRRRVAGVRDLHDPAGASGRGRQQHGITTFTAEVMPVQPPDDRGVP